MKKILIILSLMLVLTACGETTEENVEETQTVEQTETVEEEPVEETVEETNIEEVANENTYEDDNVKVVIKDYEFMEGEFDTDIVALTIDFTNKNEKPIDPWFGFPLKGEQETDDTVELLNGANGLYPEGYKTEAVEMTDKQIKQGSTVEAVVGFELVYPDSLVYLRDWGGEYEYILERE